MGGIGQSITYNRLIKEKSPYLLQHACNPVDWYPWGDEACEKAKKENKPILLSIGYSTCHWCHVMEKKSFSDPDIAAIMNKYFVSIKVDREERPDIDTMYMHAVTAMTGRGGWPLTVFLTPDLKPFYGGTYFPPDDKWGRPGFKTVLNSVADNWINHRDELLTSTETFTEILRLQTQFESKESVVVLGAHTLKKAYLQFCSNFDSTYGGFGIAPKFLNAHVLSFLLRYWKRTGESKALEIVEKTLTEMAKGGIHDHVGGGFHRYATDQQWRVPHFEKMLYDQAVIAKIYLEAYQATGKVAYAHIAGEVFDYVLRRMTHVMGGFCSAEDADSAIDAAHPYEKKEGAFYVWKKEELIRVLGEKKGAIFCYHFGVEKQGNLLRLQREFIGENILYVAHSVEETARNFKRSPLEIEGILGESKKRLFSLRSQRAFPYCDDKILVDWNGLMISSLSFGSLVLNEPRYREAAEKAAQFILKNLINEEGKISHRYREGESAVTGMIDDYAFFIHGLIDLYEASFNPEYLFYAKNLTYKMLKIFWDSSGGGLFFTADDISKGFVRQKEIYDGAVPSGNSIAALDLIRLSLFTMDEEFESKQELIFQSFSHQISETPHSYPQMLIALDFMLGPAKEIAIVGTRGSKDTKDVLTTVYTRFIPNKVVAFCSLSVSENGGVEQCIPFLKEVIPLNDKTTVYVWDNYTCKLPATNLKCLEKMLSVC